jgi:WD40 repeat protein
MTIKLWDIDNGACVRTLQNHTSTVTTVAMLADGIRALSGSADNKVKLWDLESGANLATWYADSAVGVMSPQRYVIGDATGAVTVLELVEE